MARYGVNWHTLSQDRSYASATLLQEEGSPSQDGIVTDSADTSPQGLKGLRHVAQKMVTSITVSPVELRFHCRQGSRCR